MSTPSTAGKHTPLRGQRTFREYTIGKLDGKQVIFGRKFLKENPQYLGLNAIYENNRMVFVENPDVLNFLQLAQKCRMVEAGASYVLNEVAQQSGLAAALKRSFLILIKISYLWLSSLFFSPRVPFAVLKPLLKKLGFLVKKPLIPVRLHVYSRPFLTMSVLNT